MLSPGHQHDADEELIHLWYLQGLRSWLHLELQGGKFTSEKKHKPQVSFLLVKLFRSNQDC